MNMLRWLLILICNTAPTSIGRLAAQLCMDRVPPYPEEEGAFRTDVAQCALGLLRRGDVEGFEYYLAKYPFDNRWLWLLDPRMFDVAFYAGRWRINSVRTARTFGKATLAPRQQVV